MGKCLEIARELERKNSVTSDIADLAEEVVLYERGNGEAQSLSVERVALERRYVLQVAEKILRAHADEITASNLTWNIRGFFDREELAVFDQLGWDKDQLRREAGRICTLVQWLKKAGTAAERSQSRSDLAAAQAEFSEKAPALEAQIANAQRELGAMQRRQRDAAAEVANRDAAIEELKKLAPPRVVEEHVRLMASLAPLVAEMGSLEARIAWIKEVETWDLDTPDGRGKVFCHCSGDADMHDRIYRKPQELLSDRIRHFHKDNPNADEWKLIVAAWVAEIPPLAKSLAEVKAKYEAGVAVVDELLGFYID